MSPEINLSMPEVRDVRFLRVCVCDVDCRV